MIVDYLDGSATTDLETEVCIVGAGPAGLAMACALVDRGVGVCILESGTWTGSDAAQQLCAGESVGDVFFDPALARLRAFGGSLRLWGGGCMPLAPMDVTVRDWVPDSGWPIDYATIMPYYERARTVFGIDTAPLEPGAFVGTPPRQPPTFDDPAVVHRVSICSPGDPSGSQRARLMRAPHAQLIVNATAIECVPVSSGAAVDHVVIQAIDGRRNTVRARHFVLACGGIENARLMLLSDSVTPGGLGNDYDQVGRRFMDHPSGRLGRIVGGELDRIVRPYERQGLSEKTPLFNQVCLSDEAQRSLRVLNSRIWVRAVEADPPAGIAALRALRARRAAPLDANEGSLIEQRIIESLGQSPNTAELPPRRTTSDPVWRLALRAGLGASDLLHALTRRLTDHRTVVPDHVELLGYFEQAPNVASRISLSDTRDALGQRRARVDWRLTPLDRHTYRVAAQVFGATIARAAGGRFEADDWLADETAPPLVHGTAHHMGTTRMSDNPRSGVVDRHCRVHGIDNLHIAGSSVFPSAGWAFPTFTIAALSLRLADQLSMRVAAERPLWLATSAQSIDADAQHVRTSAERRDRVF